VDKWREMFGEKQLLTYPEIEKNPDIQQEREELEQHR
jgi:hypothetical protein